MSHTAFFYGTLMAPEVLRRIIYGHHAPTLDTASLSVRPAILHQHQRHKVRHADYPAVLRSSAPGASVRGSLVSGLSDADMWRLDIFEGSEYERRTVSVRLCAETPCLEGNAAEDGDGDAEVDAETYIWTAGSHRLEAEEWDFDEFVREKMLRWVGVEPGAADEGFQHVDDAVAAIKDDPTGGRGVNGSITKALENKAETESVTVSAV